MNIFLWLHIYIYMYMRWFITVTRHTAGDRWLVGVCVGVRKQQHSCNHCTILLRIVTNFSKSLLLCMHVLGCRWKLCLNSTALSVVRRCAVVIQFVKVLTLDADWCCGINLDYTLRYIFFHFSSGCLLLFYISSTARSHAASLHS